MFSTSDWTAIVPWSYAEHFTDRWPPRREDWIGCRDSRCRHPSHYRSVSPGHQDASKENGDE